MEEDLYRTIKSPVLSKPDIQKEMENLEYAIEESQKRIDFTVANDPEIQKAIRIVERFLRKKRRVCYGGTAINELLPSSLKFYDPKYQIPDYDMFTPDVKGDVEELIRELEEEGFTELNEKIGIHEGTRKVLVNFIPIADFTQMDDVLFRAIYKRSYVVDGIHYCDPDFLRMMMYLELSRPRGQVDRWKKVFERLTLLEKAHPMKPCRASLLPPQIEIDVREKLLSLIIKRKRVLAGIDAIDYYKKGSHTLRMEDLLKMEGVVVFFSQDAKHDAEDLIDIIGNGIKIEERKAIADDFFSSYFVRLHRKPIALIIQENACHGYVPVKLSESTTSPLLRIASLDLLMNLYLSFVVFGKKEERFLQIPVICAAELIYEHLKHYRKSPTKQVHAFAIQCSGRQKGFASLQKERIERQKREKKGTKKTVVGGRRRGRQTRRLYDTVGKERVPVSAFVRMD